MTSERLSAASLHSRARAETYAMFVLPCRSRCAHTQQQPSLTVRGVEWAGQVWSVTLSRRRCMGGFCDKSLNTDTRRAEARPGKKKSCIAHQGIIRTPEIGSRHSDHALVVTSPKLAERHQRRGSHPPAASAVTALHISQCSGLSVCNHTEQDKSNACT